MGVAIVVHGTNWRDIAVKDEEGNPICTTIFFFSISNGIS
jgi:hypothetical protein